MSVLNSHCQRQVCAFTLGDHLFGIDVRHVQEVFRFQDYTPVPLTPPLVRVFILRIKKRAKRLIDT